MYDILVRFYIYFLHCEMLNGCDGKMLLDCIYGILLEKRKALTWQNHFVTLQRKECASKERFNRLAIK